MDQLILLSFGFNLLLILFLLYLIFNGKKLIEKFFVEKVINVRHQQKLSMFKSCPISIGSIIFLGDSITEGGNWSELFEKKKILNRGIGGDVTAGVLARIDEIIRHQASKVFIAIGTNDLARRLEVSSIISNYESIIKAIQKGSPETKIYVQSVLPVGPKVLFGHKNDKIILLNKEIQKMCKNIVIPYLDVYSEMLNENGELIHQYTNDNLHLLGNAYLVWKKVILSYVEE